MQKLEHFSVTGYHTKESDSLPVVFQETMQVTDGVECDVYIHPETQERDLGVIRVAPGKKTPLQRVVAGDQTIEGYLEGEGELFIRHKDGSESIFKVDQSAEGFCFLIELGDIIQWRADKNVGLKFFEICYPPYQDGRFENLDELE